MTTTKKIELWKAEFGASYKVPKAIAEAEGITDISWHNDICPSFVWAALDVGPEGEEPLRLWVEHVDPDLREGGPSAERFWITAGMDADESLYSGEDAAEALRRFIEERDKRMAPDACATCSNGHRMPEEADLRIVQEGHSATVYCRRCGRCLQA